MKILIKHEQLEKFPNSADTYSWQNPEHYSAEEHTIKMLAIGLVFLESNSILKYLKGNET